MADNLTTQTTVSTPPSGSVIGTRQVTYSGDANAHIAPVGLVAFSGADDAKVATDLPGDASNGLDVDVTRVSGNVTVVQGTAANLKVDPSSVTSPISAASLPLPTGASTSAKQPALGTAGSASTDVLTIQGIASMTKLLVTPDSVALPANQSINLNQIVGTSADVNSGLKSAGTLRVVLATDQPALTNKLLVTPDSVALPANQSVNVNQLAGTGVAVNSGSLSAGVQRVTLATDQVQLTNALKVDPSAVTSPVSIAATVGVKILPQTTGGFTTYHLVSAASTNATNVKASAGQLFGWYIYNSNAAARKVAFHNSASAPTAGASIFFTIVIPPTSAANVFTETGIAFSSGIGITTVTDLTDAGATAVAASDLIINLFYA